MFAVLVASSLLLISKQAASINYDQEKCKAAAEQAGVDFENFRYNVGHLIHSLTVEDVRFFFDENFPVENNIPNNSFAKGLTSLEELGHAAHMMEMLFRTSQM